MQTVQPILKRGRDVWDPINLPHSEFQTRINNIKSIMLQNSIDALLLNGNGIDHCSYPCYVSNYSPVMPGGVIALLSNNVDECIIFAEISSRDLPYAKQTAGTGEIRSCKNAADECINYLENKCFAPGTIGLAGLEYHMPYHQYQSIHNSLSSCHLVSCEDILDRVMMVKSSRECDQIRRAGRIISRVFNYLQDAVSPDMSELTLESIIEKSVFIEGAEDCRVLISRLLSNDYLLRPAENLHVSAEQGIAVYLAVRYERYWAEAIRTLQLEDHCLKKHTDDKLESLYRQIIEMVRPGKKSSDLFEEIMIKLKQENYTFVPGFKRGGGIGLSRSEWPLINAEDSTLLQEGMTVSLSLAVNIHGSGIAMIGNTLTILEDKSEQMVN